MSLHQHHIPANGTAEVIGYCEGCEKSDAVLVECHEGFHITVSEYCAPCMEANEEGDAHADFADRVNQRAENGWRDA
jgi:hypothetical protein